MSTDARRHNGGGTRGLTHYLRDARDSAPDDATDGEICRVAWLAFEDERNPADVWPEVVGE